MVVCGRVAHNIGHMHTQTYQFNAVVTLLRLRELVTLQQKHGQRRPRRPGLIYPNLLVSEFGTRVFEHVLQDRNNGEQPHFLDIPQTPRQTKTQLSVGVWAGLSVTDNNVKYSQS